MFRSRQYLCQGLSGSFIRLCETFWRLSDARLKILNVQLVSVCVSIISPWHDYCRAQCKVGGKSSFPSPLSSIETTSDSFSICIFYALIIFESMNITGIGKKKLVRGPTLCRLYLLYYVIYVRDYSIYLGVYVPVCLCVGLIAIVILKG